MNLVIVESPAKAKTINKYLGKDYKVIASYGHIRDLPPRNGSVLPEQNFTILYELNENGNKRLKEIAEAAKNSDIIYLATDPDREGEAISWHVIEALREKKKLKKNVKLQRIVFHEITKNSIIEAFKKPRDIDMNLVNAQQARRALDYLVGFNLSPLLWRKLPGSKSAGRVQSVALRLICDREQDIEAFISREYWDIKADLTTIKAEKFSATLTHFQGKKLEQFSITTAAQAQEYVDHIAGVELELKELIPKQHTRNPPPPFTTASLQQEAARKLGFSAKQTMQIAQKLYEGLEINGEVTGLITYMRTDGVQIAPEAISQTRNLINKTFGKEYLPPKERLYKSKVKNSQEAHEAIRPTNIDLLPSVAKKFLDDKQAKLYELIWIRMVACQMESAILDQLIAIIVAKDGRCQFKAIGSHLLFDGFYKLYKEGEDDTKQEEHKILPAMKQGDPIYLTQLNPAQHFTEAPPRFSEASLIKKLEELGIGRPSTYAPIISVLQERNYVKLEKKRFIPEERGRLVTAFLISFFQKYVEYDFTANLEEQLDHVSAGELSWNKMLQNFWKEFHTNITEVKEHDISMVLEALNELLKDHLFPSQNANDNPRKCHVCNTGQLSLKLGRFGAFIACSSYPDCTYRRQIGEPETGGVVEGLEDTIIGLHPEENKNILLKKGPYGYYLQLGEEGKKLKRVSIPKNIPLEKLDLETAISLLRLPREVGIHPTSGKAITASIGPYGPYLAHEGKFTSIPKELDVLTITLEVAVKLLESKTNILRQLGKFPETGEEITVMRGRFGPYINCGKLKVKITDIDSINLENAIELLTAKRLEQPKPPKSQKKT